MGTNASRPPVQPGEPAPDFALPAVQREGTVSLGDYRGTSPLLLAIFRGIYCPFCRRAIAQLGPAAEKLRAAGVESLAVVATDLANARLYFKYRPTRLALACDPELTTHRAYGLPQVPATEETLRMIGEARINPTGELREPLPILEASKALDELHGFRRTEADRRDDERQFGQLKGHFLLDREGIVRWANVECATDGVAGFGKFPGDDELLAAARALG